MFVIEYYVSMIFVKHQLLVKKIHTLPLARCDSFDFPLRIPYAIIFTLIQKPFYVATLSAQLKPTEVSEQPAKSQGRCP